MAVAKPIAIGKELLLLNDDRATANKLLIMIDWNLGARLLIFHVHKSISKCAMLDLYLSTDEYSHDLRLLLHYLPTYRRHRTIASSAIIHLKRTDTVSF